MGEHLLVSRGAILSSIMVSPSGLTTISGVGAKISKADEISSSFSNPSSGSGRSETMFAAMASEASSEECTNSSKASLPVLTLVPILKFK
ncbi:hypothetical protein V6N12_030899 [Hibiscus sabdariffa]|uniref:Uncharacterized protein n=1 Tax=Hibiscus sabdariffa TaxID=183260 RepID=A0ABR2EAW7_9ROSI